MKVKLGQLRQLVKEEMSRLHEAGKKPALVPIADILSSQVPVWDEAARSLKLKSFIKFVPGHGGEVTVMYQGYGTDAAARKQATSMGKKLTKAAEKTLAGRAAEKPVDDQKVYDLLTFAFTSTVSPEDVQYIRFQPLKNAVRMVDYDGMLGNMDAGVSANDLARYGLNPRQLADWLAAHGARAMKPQKRPRPAPPVYD